MSLNDPLANALSHILNCDRLGKKTCLISPNSKVIRAILDILKANNMIGQYELVDERRGGVISVSLLGRINKCSVIKPRFSFRKDDIEMFEKRYLPGVGFGMLIVSTPKGMMTHTEAIQKGVGGKLLAYCY